MKNILRYREYVGSVEIDEHEGFLYGRVLGIQEKITYRAERADELVRLFRAEIDAYLDRCARENVAPEIPYKGSFNVRIAPALHRRLAIHAVQNGVNLNRLVETILASYEPLYAPEKDVLS
ncbi:type II toxin-antitoxin system HicB family antitoxin [uncultured Selenomonas sp.]|uniref:type II toxin-antitoxin system HicB family antitoxin n=1 Tax=uncultured Selenomonas sp. TaxID=159275 RepID=UPI0028E81A29|nr:type II toxin-antitoxin system HicB family antitoxin [uncultured Selenomonas sp.]